MKTKRIISVILMLAMVITMLPAVVFADTNTLEIVGSDKFISISGDRYSKMPYKLTSDSTEVTADSWSVTEDNVVAGDVWFVDGNLVVKGGAEGTYTLTATYGGQTVSKDITITKSILYDWSTAATSLGSNNTAVDTDDKNNVYVDASKSVKKDLTTDNTLTNGIKTVEYDFRVPSSDTGNVTAVEEAAAWYDSIKHADDESGDTYYLYRHKKDVAAKNIKSGLSYGEWYNIKLVYNLDVPNYSIYCENDKTSVAKDIAISGINCSYKYRFYMNVDNMVVYSGEECESPLSLTITSDKSLLIPPLSGKKAQTKFTLDEGLLDTTGAEWSIVDKPAWAEIDSATGVVTVTNAAAAGSLTIKATKDAYEDTAQLNLSAITEPVDANGTHFTYGTVVEDAETTDNYYYAKSSNTDAQWRYNQTDIPYSADSSSIVYDMRVKGSQVTFYTLTNSFGGTTWHGTAQVSSFSNCLSWPGAGKWFNLVVIVNPQTNKFSVYCEGQPVELTKNEGLSAEITSVNSIAVSYVDVDEIKIYNVSNDVPSAANLRVDNLIPGETATLNYDYISMDGAANISTFSWEISDKEDSGFDTISAQTARTIDIDSSWAGKYLRATVTPRHADRYNSETIISGEAVSITVRIKPALEIKYTVKDNKDAETAVPIDPSVTAPEDGKYLIANVAITQIDDTPRSVMIAIAKYSDSGKLMDICNEKILTTSAKGQSANDNIVVDSVGGNIKLFVWDSATLKPLIGTQIVK